MSSTSETATDKIRDVIRSYARLPVEVESLADEDDLYQAGMTSQASVNVMLGLEDAFDVEFPDSLLRRDTFRSVASILGALETLGVGAP